MRFVHLHTHSHYSLLEAVPKIPDLVARVKELGMDAVALTDHGALYGAIEFWQEAIKAGIKPIVGMEAYLAPYGRKEKRAKIDDRPQHLTLLAETNEGYKNLMKLSSIGFLEGFYYKPRIDKEALRDHSRGLIALSGCLRGEIPQTLANHQEGKAATIVREYQEIFGKDNFFLELVHHPEFPLQQAVNTQLIELARMTGAPLVATRDAHYLKPEDQETRLIVLAIQLGKTIDELRREDAEINYHLSSPEEMIAAFTDVPEAIENTARIADRCQAQIDLGKWNFPVFDVPQGLTIDQYLRQLVSQGLSAKVPEVTADIQARLDYELEIITKRGFSPYFLVVADYVNWARANGIISTTRGSAAGSLVSYALGVTTVNPLAFRLPFERFLNPSRPSPPDIDMDFADNKRDEVIKYVTEKYGADKVAQICTFGAMMARGAARDVGRALGYPYSFCDRVAKSIPFGSQGFPMTIARAKVESDELKQLYGSSAEVRRLLDLAERIEGNARHISVHAAGVVISPGPLVEFTPLQRESGGERIITQYEMNAVEAAGVLKMDFLGIRNLSILEHAVELVRKIKGVEVDLLNLPLDDKKTYELLARGDTIGLFQLNGTGMTRYLVELKPSNIFDIMAMVALFRPGPMESIPEFIRRKHNPALIKYLDPRMKEILSMSYGVITYQDDVLLTAIQLAGYTWEEADKLRKAMGKKIPAEMAKQKDKFIQGCVNHGKIKEAIAQGIWKLIEPFAAYGFNKCLPAETVIMDVETGERITIGELYKTNKRPMLATLDDTLRLGKQKIKGVHSNGEKFVWKIVTRTGRYVRATGNHPFLTIDGWQELCKLKVGDRIAVPRSLPLLKKTINLEQHKLIALGYLLSEGNLCHPYGIYFYSTSEAECRDFLKAALCFNNTRAKYDRSKSAISVYIGKKSRDLPNGLMAWIRELGLAGKKATEKSFPSCVFRLSNDHLAVLLGKLWQGDGCIHSMNHGQIFYATSSRRLAVEVQHLLLRLGIVTGLHQKRFAYRGDWRFGWTVVVSSAVQIRKFAETVGKHLLPDKQAVLHDIVIQKNSRVMVGVPMARGTRDTIPVAIQDIIRLSAKRQMFTFQDAARSAGVSGRLFLHDRKKKGFTREAIWKIGEALHDKIIKQYASSDVLWDEIKAIIPYGKEETFDIAMPEPHNFVANDMIVHNSHAASYGIVAYQTAYMKANFMAEFMTAVLTAESGDLPTVAEVVEECRKLGIAVLPPDVNESNVNFTYIDDNHIRFGLLAIKNLGEDVARGIIEEREKVGGYQDLADFARRVSVQSFNRKSLEALIRSGALDRFGERNMLLANIDMLLAFRRASQHETLANQASLFGAGSGPRLQLRSAEPASRRELLAWEKELLGLYISEHPFAEFSRQLEGRIEQIGACLARAGERTVRLAGIITQTRDINTKTGQVMCFARLEDGTGGVELVIFPRVLLETREHLRVDECIIVSGKLESREGSVGKIICETIWPLSEANIGRTARALERNS